MCACPYPESVPFARNNMGSMGKMCLSVIVCETAGMWLLKETKKITANLFYFAIKPTTSRELLQKNAWSRMSIDHNGAYASRISVDKLAGNDTISRGGKLGSLGVPPDE